MKKAVFLLLLGSRVISAQPIINSGSQIITKATQAAGVVSGTTTITGGATTQVCFNDGATLSCGDAAFVFDKATGKLTITTLGNTFTSGTLKFGGTSSAFPVLSWNTVQTPDSLTLGLGTNSRSLVIHEAGDEGFDYAHPQQTNPTIFFHSAAQSTTQWGSLTHDGTSLVINTGVFGEGVSITGSGGGKLGIATGGILDLIGNTYIRFGAGSQQVLDRTITAGGTTGAQTINKMAGTVNFAAVASSVVITDSLVTVDSLVFAVMRTADATCTFIKSVVPGSGSFTITVNAACTAETSVGFWVTN